jgi:hypothetical protein
MKQRKLRVKVWLTRDFWGNAAPIAAGIFLATVNVALRIAGIDLTSTLEDLGAPAIAAFIVFVMVPTMLVMFHAPLFFAQRRLSSQKRRLVRVTKRIEGYDGPRKSPGRSSPGLHRDCRSPDTITRGLIRILQKRERIEIEIQTLTTYVRRLSKPLAWSH